MNNSTYEQHVSAFLRDGVMTLNRSSKTDDGLWYLQEPFVSIGVEEGADKIGGLLMEMLGRVQTAVCDEEFTQEFLARVFAKMLAEIGVASVEELVETAVHCSVGKGNGRIELTPTQKGSPDEMFTFLHNAKIVINVAQSKQAIGNALLDCFKLCK